MKEIKEIRVVIVSGTAQSVEIRGYSVLLENSGSGTVYFRDCGEDGVECSQNNGFALAAGAMMPEFIRANVLSVAGTGELRIMVMEA